MARYLRPKTVRNINFISINDLNFDRPATIADVKQETIAPTTTTKTFSSIVNISDGNIVNSLQVDGNAIIGDDPSDTCLINASLNIPSNITFTGNLNGISATTINEYNNRITNNTNNILTKKDITEYNAEKAIIEGNITSNTNNILTKKDITEYNAEKAIIDDNVNDLVDVNNSQNNSITTINNTLTTINGTLTSIDTDMGIITSDITTINNNITTINDDIIQLQTDLNNIPPPDLSNYALTSYVDTSISNLVSSAPSTLDTLNELATALGNDPNFATTVTNSIASKQNIINSSNRLDASNIGTGIISNVEYDYLNGLSANIQNQIDGKLSSSDDITFTGNLTANSNLTTTKIIEKNNAVTVSAGVSTCDFNNGSVFYITGQTANFRCDIANIPNAINRTFTISLIINTSSQKFYANTLRVNSTTRTVLFSGGASSINISSSSFVIQQISVVYTSDATIPTVCFSSVIPLFA